MIDKLKYPEFRIFFQIHFILKKFLKWLGVFPLGDKLSLVNN